MKSLFKRATAPFSSGPAPYDDEELYTRPARSYGGIIKWAVILAILAGGAGVAFWQRHAITSMVASFRSKSAPKPKDTAQPATRPKIADRIGQSQATTPDAANAPAAAVAQKVVLYDEDPNDPQGKRYVGSALWVGCKLCRLGRGSRLSLPCAPTSRYRSASCA